MKQTLKQIIKLKLENSFSVFTKTALLDLISKSGKRNSLFLIAFLFLIPLGIKAEESDSVKITRNFSGSASVTTKGLSTFPNLTLGKPAAIFDFSMGGEKFRFEPTLRFGLDGKPWSFIFWFRYELLKTNKFQFKIGAHPAYAFKTISVTENGNTSEIHRVQQFVAGELAPVYFLTKSISAGPYYIYARGISKGAVKNSNFVSLRFNFSNIQVTDNYFLRWMLQGYYLKMDLNDGFYVNSTLSFNRHNFPFSVSSTINKALETTIPGDDFLWNINLTYAFGGRYRKL